jgi:hypothetical protein
MWSASNMKRAEASVSPPTLIPNHIQQVVLYQVNSFCKKQIFIGEINLRSYLLFFLWIIFTKLKIIKIQSSANPFTFLRGGCFWGLNRDLPLLGKRSAIWVYPKPLDSALLLVPWTFYLVILIP